MNKSVRAYFEKLMPDGITRYYLVERLHDLFDDVVVCRWGTNQSLRGGSKSYPVADDAQAFELIEQFTMRRIKRGYVRMH